MNSRRAAAMDVDSDEDVTFDQAAKLLSSTPTSRQWVPQDGVIVKRRAVALNPAMQPRLSTGAMDDMPKMRVHASMIEDDSDSEDLPHDKAVRRRQTGKPASKAAMAAHAAASVSPKEAPQQPLPPTTLLALFENVSPLVYEHAQFKLFVGMLHLRAGNASQACDALAAALSSFAPASGGVSGKISREQAALRASIAQALAAAAADDGSPARLAAVQQQLRETKSWAALGRVLLASGEASEAAAVFTLLTQGLPDGVDPWANLGAAQLLGDGSVEQAAAAYQHVLSKDARHLEALAGYAAVCISAKRPKQAVALLHYSLRLDDCQAHAWSLLGVAFRMLGRSDEALAAMNRSHALQHSATQRPTASADFNLVQLLLQRAPTSPSALARARGLLLSLMTRAPHGAEAVPSQLRSVFPRDAALSTLVCNKHWALLARVLSLTGDQSLALAAAAHAGDDETSAQLHLQARDWARAEECLERLVSRTPQSGLEVHLSNLAVALLNQGKLDRAAEVCEQALQRAPRCSQAWLLLGHVRKALNQDAEAEKAYKRCLSLGKLVADAHCGLAALEQRASRHGKAAEHLQRALHAEPGHKAAQHNARRLQTRSRG